MKSTEESRSRFWVVAQSNRQWRYFAWMRALSMRHWEDGHVLEWFRWVQVARALKSSRRRPN